MEKVIVCQCKTSRDCINYVQTGKENDFSCRHYVNPQDIEDVNTGMDCINYVTEAGLSDYKAVLTRTIEKQKDSPAFMESITKQTVKPIKLDEIFNEIFKELFGELECECCNCCCEECEDCDCMEDDDFYDDEDIENAYDKGYKEGYEQGWNDAVTEEAVNYLNEDDCEEEEGILEPLRRFVGRVSGRLPEHKNKPIYIAIEKADPMKVLGFCDIFGFSQHVIYSDIKSDIEKEIKDKTDMIAIDFDKWKASYETEDYPIDEQFLFHIKFTK